jgi:pyruvate formate lyase activating enzyme
MKIKGFQKNSFVDFPGRLAAVVWTPGCNFRCPYCYNRELVLDSAALPEVSKAAVLKHLDREKAFLQGVVVTGGEPTLQRGLEPFLAEVRARGLLVKLDTNGTRPEVIRGLLARKLVDLVALDLKTALTPGAYARATGRPEAAAREAVQAVAETLALLMDSGVACELRTTVVPGLVEEPEVMEIVEFCRAQHAAGCAANRYALQNYFPAPATIDPAFAALKPWPRARLEALADRVRPVFGEVVVRSQSE